MKEIEENQNVRKQETVRIKKKNIDVIESKNIRHQKHDFRHRKIDIQQDELWEEWQQYYK
jgi:hypothetical protein